MCNPATNGGDQGMLGTDPMISYMVGPNMSGIGGVLGATAADYLAAGATWDTNQHMWMVGNTELSIALAPGSGGFTMASIGWQDGLGVLGASLGARYAAQLGVTELVGGSLGGVGGLVAGAALDWAINHPDQIRDAVGQRYNNYMERYSIGGSPSMY